MSEKDLNQRFSDYRKMDLVAKSWKLKGEQLGRFLRETGICSVELNSWREQMSDGLKDNKPIRRNYKKELDNKIRLLERELQAAKAVIELQKKVQNLHAENEDKNTISPLEQKSLATSKKL